MTEAVVDEEGLVHGLRRLGLRAGDVVFVHSSLRAFGHVVGGAPAVVRALLALAGEQGTLVAPIFRHFFWDGPEQVWDRQRSPSLMGAISEAVRRWPGAVPTRHAPHPVAAIGPRAAALAACRNRTDFAFDSPFARLLEWDAWILLLGVDLSVCTFVHLLEERAAVPYRHWVELTGTVIDGGVARQESYPFYRQQPGVHNDFLPLQRLLARARSLRCTRVGAARVRACRTRALYEAGMRALRDDPLFLVSADTRAAASRYVPDHGAWIASVGEDPGAVRAARHPLARRLAVRLHVRRPETEPRAVERLVWHTDDGLELRELRLEGGPSPVVPAMLALPRQAAAPRPAVICLHGTGGSWEDTMEADLQPHGSVLRGWGRALARQGFAVLAITQLCHPPRPEPWNWEWPKLLQLYGQTAMGRLVADVCAALDYLLAVPGVDPGRVAVAGYSLGGIAAFYSHVIDERLRAAVIFCGGVGSLAALVRAGAWGYHSVYYHVPGLLADGLDHPELVAALPPRPLLLCAATEDQGMPLAGVERCAAAARRAYAAAGAPAAFALRVDPGPHAHTPGAFAAAQAWLQAHLQAAGSSAPTTHAADSQGERRCS